MGRREVLIVARLGAGPEPKPPNDDARPLANDLEPRAFAAADAQIRAEARTPAGEASMMAGAWPVRGP